MPERQTSVAQGRPDAYEQLLREIALTKENFETRLDAIDKATSLLQSRADRVPQIETVAENLRGLKELNEEKFASIALQFKERDARLEQTTMDSKAAIEAALEAAKEAAGKTEVGLTKQIDAIAANQAVTVNALHDKIDDMKTRITAIESRTEGLQNAKKEQQTDSTYIWGIIFGLGGFLVAVAAVVVTIVK